ncbi:SNARE-interacting protein KEULE, partial [Haematococcus lacustris]
MLTSCSAADWHTSHASAHPPALAGPADWPSLPWPELGAGCPGWPSTDLLPDLAQHSLASSTASHSPSMLLTGLPEREPPGAVLRSVLAEKLAHKLLDRLEPLQRAGQLPAGETCDLLILDRWAWQGAAGQSGGKAAGRQWGGKAAGRQGSRAWPVSCLTCSNPTSWAASASLLRRRVWVYVPSVAHGWQQGSGQVWGAPPCPVWELSYDPVAPVIHEWTYEALVHDLLPME